MLIFFRLTITLKENQWNYYFLLLFFFSFFLISAISSLIKWWDPIYVFIIPGIVNISFFSIGFVSALIAILYFPNALIKLSNASTGFSKCSSTLFILLIPLFPYAAFLLQLCPPALLWLGWVLGLMHSWYPRTCLHPFGCWRLFLSSPILALLFPYSAFLFSSWELWESLFLVQVFSYSLCLEHGGSFCIISLMAPFLCFFLFSLKWNLSCFILNLLN